MSPPYAIQCEPTTVRLSRDHDILLSDYLVTSPGAFGEQPIPPAQRQLIATASSALTGVIVSGFSGNGEAIIFEVSGPMHESETLASPASGSQLSKHPAPHLEALTAQPRRLMTTNMLGSLISRILALRALPANWNGEEAIQPSSISISRALALLTSTIRLTRTNGLEWLDPNVTADDDGAVVLEWWGSGSRKLTVYVEPDSNAFIRVWGRNIENEMEDGVLYSPARLVSLLEWLVTGEEPGIVGKSP